MKSRIAVFVSLAVAMIFPAGCDSTQKEPASNRQPEILDSVESRIDGLLSKMSVEEKVAQLQCTTSGDKWREWVGEKSIGGVGCVLRSFNARKSAEVANEIQRLAREKTRCGIPVMIHDEALHGLVGQGATSFPQAIGLAATWDTDLMERVSQVIAIETKSRGIRQVLAPVINIARDVRWGRVEETYGEDPFLTARLAVAYCRALEAQGVVTTPKHFVANIGDGGRDSNAVHFSERLLREIYLPPFEACFKEAGSTSVMCAYNALDDEPCASNDWLLTKLLRREWGFRGFVVSDYGAVAGIKDMHHVEATEHEAAARGVSAGLDVELPDVYFYGAPLVKAVKEGRLSMKALDAAVRNVLRAKLRLGLFEHPYADPDLAEKESNSKDHRAIALEAARESIVLLKNEKGILPLRKELKSIAVIGPRADARDLGGYSGWGTEVVSILDGIRKTVPGAQVHFAKGCELGRGAVSPIPEECLTPAGAKEVEHGLKGEYFNNKELKGEPVLVRIDKQISFDWGVGSPDPKIDNDHFSIRWTGKLVPRRTANYKLGATTDDGVRLWLDGRCLIDSWHDRAATLDVVAVHLEKGREYDIKIEYYENEGVASASLGWATDDMGNPMIAEAVETAKKSDVAVIVAGIIEGEGQDRSHLDLPGDQEELIKSVAATGRPVVVVLVAGSAVTMQKWIDDVPAIVDAWYGGEEAGTAVAEVLFGDVNPSGKLPVTFPQYVGQVPLYYNAKPTGRGYDYVDLSYKPLFPFGHGLSYTSFEYANLKIEPGQIKPSGRVTVSFDLRNTGARAGATVTELYVRHPRASMAPPLLQLKGFKRVMLPPGESQHVTFELGPEHLSILGKEMRWVVDPGPIEILIGRSAEDFPLRGTLEVIH